jgi:hypothetical protein
VLGALVGQGVLGSVHPQTKIYMGDIYIYIYMCVCVCVCLFVFAVHRE